MSREITFLGKLFQPQRNGIYFANSLGIVNINRAEVHKLSRGIL